MIQIRSKLKHLKGERETEIQWQTYTEKKYYVKYYIRMGNDYQNH